MVSSAELREINSFTRLPDTEAGNIRVHFNKLNDGRTYQWETDHPTLHVVIELQKQNSSEWQGTFSMREEERDSQMERNGSLLAKRTDTGFELYPQGYANAETWWLIKRSN